MLRSLHGRDGAVEWLSNSELGGTSMLALSFTALLAVIAFPGEQYESRSPNRKASIVWSEATETSPHRIYLRVESEQFLLIEFPRHLSVAWSPDSHFIAFTNYEGSDLATLHLFTANIPPREIRLQLPPSAQTVMSRNHHAYAELVRWRGSRFAARVHGYGFSRHGEESVTVWCEETGVCRLAPRN